MSTKTRLIFRVTIRLRIRYKDLDSDIEVYKDLDSDIEVYKDLDSDMDVYKDLDLDLESTRTRQDLGSPNRSKTQT